MHIVSEGGSWHAVTNSFFCLAKKTKSKCCLLKEFKTQFSLLTCSV